MALLIFNRLDISKLGQVLVSPYFCVKVYKSPWPQARKRHLQAAALLPPVSAVMVELNSGCLSWRWITWPRIECGAKISGSPKKLRWEWLKIQGPAFPADSVHFEYYILILCYYWPSSFRGILFLTHTQVVVKVFWWCVVRLQPKTHIWRDFTSYISWFMAIDHDLLRPLWIWHDRESAAVWLEISNVWILEECRGQTELVISDLADVCNSSVYTVVVPISTIILLLWKMGMWRCHVGLQPFNLRELSN